MVASQNPTERNATLSTLLIAAIGDIHGRFHRVAEWLAKLEEARGRAVSFALAVGDVEAFESADDHRRKAAKRGMPAEFSEYASGARAVARPLYFIGGNNEDFSALAGMPKGGEVAPNVHYLGRAGAKMIQGVRVAYLSGIYAPRYIEKPLLAPSTPETFKQAGYFRTDDVRVLDHVTNADLMLVHEWPRGIVSRADAERRGIHRALRAWRFPWIGNPVTRGIVDRIRPNWLFCGHSHTPFSTTLARTSRRRTHVACLDQAAHAEGALLWLEWEAGRALRAGWGHSGEVAWEAGEGWDESVTPEDPKAAEHEGDAGPKHAAG